MKKPNRIAVFIIYCSKQDREASFHDIVEQKDLLDIADYEINRFWDMSGGIEIVIDGYNSIFRSTNFNCLVNATSFLIHSLYWIKGEKLDWFNADEAYPSDVVLRTTSAEILRLRNANDNEVTLSFASSKGKYNGERGERYFENIRVDKGDWCDAVKLGLSEYFQILLRVIENSPGDETYKIIMDYYHAWEHIK